MIRFLVFSGALWLALLLFSSAASAAYVCPATGNTVMYQFESEAQAQCDAFIASMSWSPKEYSCSYFSWSNGTQSIAAYADGTRLGTNTYTYCSDSPSCDAPDYFDSDTGECVTPEEFCYTELESMADECILLGPGDPDPNDEIPPGCVGDSTGKQVCLTEDPNCYTINGVQACAKEDSVCGWKNGTWNCVAPEEEGCGYFNGERVCFTPDGEQVPNDSPDHPDNGGNLDGDDSNDVTDPRDPTEGGDPNNQPGESDSSSTDAATEKTARDSLNKLRDIDKGISGVKSAVEQGFSSLIEESNPAQVEGIAQDIANTPIAGLQDLEDGIGLNPLDGDAADGVGNSVTGLVPQGTCSQLGFNFNGHAFGLPCDKTQKIRDMLSWVLYFLTVWMLFDIVTSPVVRRA